MNNDQKFELLVTETRPKLLSALCRMLPPEDAKDVLQEAYTRTYQVFLSDPELEAKAYLYKVSRNIAISRLRHDSVVKRSAPKLQLVTEEWLSNHHAEHLLAKRQEEARLQAAIDSLPPACKKVFILRKLHEQTHTQIAEQLRISVKTVENHLAKGMQLCRKFICSEASKAKHHKHPEGNDVAG